MSAKLDITRDIGPAQLESIKKELHRAGSLDIEIVSASMSPILKVGHNYTLLPILDFSKLRRFDMIIYNQDGILICHYLFRLPEPGRNYYQTRPLFQVIDDVRIQQNQILGILENQIPWYWRLFLVLRMLWKRAAGL